MIVSYSLVRRADIEEKFTNVAYVDPNMESIFDFNNLRFSPDMVSVRQALSSRLIDTIFVFLRWHFPHFVFSLNKRVHSDAQFYRTAAELNYAKVRAC